MTASAGSSVSTGVGLYRDDDGAPWECIQMLSQPACRTYVAIEKDSYPVWLHSALESHFHVLSKEY